MSNSVILLPSVQPHSGLDGYVEGEGMRVIAELVYDMLLDLPGYDVEVYWPGYEDGQSFEMLRKQREWAELWLRSRPARHADKVVLHLHSGSGPRSRVLGVPIDEPDGKRRAPYHLARATARAVARAMRTRGVGVASRLEGKEYGEYLLHSEQPFTTALIKCGSRCNSHDARILSDMPYVVARGVINGLQAYFESRPGAGPGVVCCDGRLEVHAEGAVLRSAPSRAGRPLRTVGPAVLITDGYTEGGQRVAGSPRWYHLARESGFGWIHSTVGRYTENGDT